MNTIKRLLMTILVMAFITLALLACEIATEPVTGSIEMPQPYAAAQSTLDYGQIQIEELSHQYTILSQAPAYTGAAYLKD